MEFGLSACGTMSALAILLADGNGRGGGDLQDEPITGIIGRWAGDKIVIAGDYADNGRFISQKDIADLKDDDGNPVTLETINLHRLADKKFKDISHDVLFALMADNYARQEIVKNNPDSKIIKEFNTIYKHLTKHPDKKDMALLVGRLKTPEGNAILEKFLKGATSPS
jgi:hypothetical protein